MIFHDKIIKDSGSLQVTKMDVRNQLKSYIYISKRAIDMNKTALKSNIGIIVAIGSIWGLTEFAFGLGLQKCATLIVGFILLVDHHTGQNHLKKRLS
jgi:hypothetical protein